MASRQDAVSSWLRHVLLSDGLFVGWGRREWTGRWFPAPQADTTGDRFGSPSPLLTAEPVGSVAPSTYFQRGFLTSHSTQNKLSPVMLRPCLKPHRSSGTEATEAPEGLPTHLGSLLVKLGEV